MITYSDLELFEGGVVLWLWCNLQNVFSISKDILQVGWDGVLGGVRVGLEDIFNLVGLGILLIE